MSIPHHSTNTSQLLALLSAGVSQSDAALKLGITASAVTQLIDTQPELQELRKQQLKRSSELDVQYDDIEDKLLKQLQRTVPLLTRPQEIAAVLTRVNQARRRGVASSSNDAPTTVVTLNLPTTIRNKFVVNNKNQVITAGSQDLVTIPSSAVSTLLTKRLEAPVEAPTILEEDEYGFTHPSSTAQGTTTSKG